jgi:hypothetical protein
MTDQSVPKSSKVSLVCGLFAFVGSIVLSFFFIGSATDIINLMDGGGGDLHWLRARNVAVHIVGTTACFLVSAIGLCMARRPLSHPSAGQILCALAFAMTLLVSLQYSQTVMATSHEGALNEKLRQRGEFPFHMIEVLMQEAISNKDHAKRLAAIETLDTFAESYLRHNAEFRVLTWPDLELMLRVAAADSDEDVSRLAKKMLSTGVYGNFGKK